MKTSLKSQLVILMLLLFCLDLSAQRKRLYKAWVYQGKSKAYSVGGLYAIDKENVMLINTWDEREIINGDFSIDTFKIENIRVIKLRKDGKIVNSAVLGAAVGAILGLALSEGMDDAWTANTMDSSDKGALAFGGAYAGAFYGLLFGLIKKKYQINGSETEYIKIYKSLEKKSYLGMTMKYP